nr:AAA family ATPase [uncultured Psychrobacter sp.]
MRLKSLKLTGFKSFANATTFSFPRGITAIVGPNGCGKSNVIDAIRWVLGETSAKQLRGGAMSDVIFAGTQDKSAKSVASVELTFEHTQDETTGIRHEFNLYHELSVRRQVNKEGRSDYFINGTRARRRDVVDVFLGTGLGARSYAVIEQGMIGRIVDSSPMQLREFIEEAAGVSRYQARRLETQKKLEITQDNLARLQDMQSELVSQQKRLSKQATSAQRYEELTLARADIQQQLTIWQLYQAKHYQQQQKQAHKQGLDEVARLQSLCEDLKAKQDKLTAHITQEQWLKDDAQSTHYQQQLGYQKAEHELFDIQNQISQIEQQIDSIHAQQSQTHTESEALKLEQSEQQALLASLRPQLNDLAVKRESYKQSERTLQRAWTDAQDKVSRLQYDMRILEQQQAINAQEQKRYQQSYDKWQRREHNWQALHVQLLPLGADHSSVSPAFAHTELTELKDQLGHIVRKQDYTFEQVAVLQPRAHELQQRLGVQQRELTENEKRHALLVGEYDTLHQMLHPKSRDDTSTQHVTKITYDTEDSDFDQVSQPLPISTIRARIELTDLGQRYAHILDEWLAPWLDSHVLLTDNNRQNLAHYVTNLLSYQKDTVGAKSGHSLWLPATQSDEVHSFMSQLAHALSKQLIPLSKLILQPRLALCQQCYLYIGTDNETEEEKRANLGRVLEVLPKLATLLTTDGWMISQQGMINLNRLIGRDNSENNSPFLTQRIEQRARLKQLETLLEASNVSINTQQQTLKQAQREYDALTISLEEARTQAAQLTQDKHHCQQQLTTCQAMYERLQADIQRLDNDKLSLEQEQQALISEQKALNDKQSETQRALDTLITQLTEAKSHRQKLQTDKNERSRVRQAEDDAWQALQLDIQKGEMRLEHSVSRLVKVTDQHDKSLQESQKLGVQLVEYQQQLPELKTRMQKIQELRDQQQALLAERESTLAALKQDYSKQQNELDALQHKLQSQQEDLAQLATQLALSNARLEDASTHAQEALAKYQSISQKYDKDAPQTMSVSNVLADFIAHDRRVRPDKIAQLKSEQAKLEHELSKIGAVNLTAITELAAVNERLEPLAQQTADIAASMQTLTEAIKSIDETTKALFMQTLDAVNLELAALFAKVFGGGHANLTLDTDSDFPKSEQWRAGLTLMAQPKGKRNSRLAVLSGGEKTLTALSLIFAIFKQHPAPFCVLDEVDAPLDDANVARFTSLIEELAGEVQFIFISHNKLSMQIADELKGITMAQAGVSTLVSVSLDEAIDYIDS